MGESDDLGESVNYAESCESNKCGESADSEEFGDSGESDHSGNSVESGDHGKYCESGDPSQLMVNLVFLVILANIYEDSVNFGDFGIWCTW